MNSPFQEKFKKTVSLLDEQINFKAFSGKTLNQYFDKFINSMTLEGAIPYVLNTKERFRASPLASSIIWMEKAKLLSQDVADQLNNKLLFLRDSAEPNDKDPGQNKKKSNDTWAWSFSEGGSVWSTSLAIIALLQRDTERIVSYKEKIKESIRWLILQQDKNEKGWAYQSYNCSVNSVTSSLAIYAIACSIAKKDVLSFNEEEVINANNSLSRGISYLKEAFGDNHYCSFMDKPSAFATVWALLSLKLIVEIDSKNIDAADLFNTKLRPSLNYIIHNIPSNEIWGNEQIVKESAANYAKHKNYYSFSPTLIPFLLDLGVSPNSPKIVKQISLLLKDDKQWTIRAYDPEGRICSFTYIMTLSTIIYWLRKVDRTNSRILVDVSNESKLKRIRRFFGGYNNDAQEPIRFIRRNRIVFYWVVLLTLLVTCIFRNQIIGFLARIIDFLSGVVFYIPVWFYRNTNNILVGIIGSIISSCVIIPILLKVWKRHKQRKQK